MGFGRVGEWFAFQAHGVGSGPHHLRQGHQLRLRAARRRGHLRSPSPRQFDNRVFPGGLTYSGHPLACAAGIATFEVFERDGILERVRDLGERVVRPTLEGWLETHPSVGEVRGAGLMWAVELVRNRETREPLVPFNASGADNAPMAAFVAAAKTGRRVAVRRTSTACTCARR